MSNEKMQRAAFVAPSGLKIRHAFFGSGLGLSLSTALPDSGFLRKFPKMPQCSPNEDPKKSKRKPGNAFIVNGLHCKL
jgi:hypothetical protein